LQNNRPNENGSGDELAKAKDILKAPVTRCPIIPFIGDNCSADVAAGRRLALFSPLEIAASE
jgi:hypothetical protein